MGSRGDFEARVASATEILARQYESIDEALAVIAKNEYRAGATCGPVSQAQFAIDSARRAISSAESTIGFFTEVAEGQETEGYNPSIAKAALAAVAKRRLQMQSDAAA